MSSSCFLAASTSFGNCRSIKPRGIIDVERVTGLGKGYRRAIMVAIVDNELNFVEFGRDVIQ